MDIESEAEQREELLMKAKSNGVSPSSVTLKGFNKKRTSIDNGSTSVGIKDVVIIKASKREESDGNGNGSESTNGLDTHLSPASFKEVSLVWKNLTYTVNNKDLCKTLASGRVREAFLNRNQVATILHSQSGCITTGSLTAVLGRSGSGKTSLIESLAGRRCGNGLKADITVNIVNTNNDGGNCKAVKLNTVKISFIPQHDSLLGTLTVEESVRFASRLKNVHNSNRKYHEKISEEMIQQLDLESCRSVYVCCCSGGQKKRLSIAMELVSKPTILILDEPTSGLDSSSALQCVQLLRKLVETQRDPIAILATIHQPNAKTLFLFHQLYLLSFDGRRIYSGPVPKLLEHFSNFGLSCPEFHNPADFAIDVASGDCGHKIITEMEKKGSDSPTEDLSVGVNHTVSDVIRATTKKSFGAFCALTCILIKRTLLTTMRDPVLNFFRFIQNVFVALVIVSLYQSTIGGEGGCQPKSGNFSYDEMLEKQLLTQQNVAFFFFSLMFLCFACMMPTVMVFPIEMSVFLKERTNGWYSCLSYYFAKTIADIPFQILYTSAYVLITYHMTGQIQSFWRFSTFLAICLLVASIGQSYGLLIGAIFCKHLNAAIFVAPVSTLPLILISGFFVKTSAMPASLQPLTYISYMKYAFEAMIITIYGSGRCDLESSTDPIHVQNSTSMSAPTVETCAALLKFYKYLQVFNVSYPTLRPIFTAYLEENNGSLSDLAYLDNQLDNVETIQFDALQKNASAVASSTASMVMKEFQLEDGDLYFNILMLLALFIVFRIVTYIIFLAKASYKR